MSDATQNNEIPVPDRLGKIETVLERVLGFMDSAAPFLAAIPGATPVVAVTEAVGHVADELLHAADNNAGNDGVHGVDTAALAAGQISKSTGNEVLDSRLAAVENLLYAAIPVVKAIAKHFAVDTDHLVVPPVPMQGA